MIEELNIKHFQSHESTNFQFHPGINAIVGASDQGKSATLRALLWAIKNQPQGTAYISDWTKTKKGKLSSKETTKVSVTNKKGTLTRYRNADENGYELPDGSTLEALRTDVPDQVKEFFNLSEVNIQKQADPPFMISMTGGEIARFFNSLVGMDEIAKAQSSVQSKQRENDKDLRTKKESLEEKQAEIEKYDDLDDILKEIEAGLVLRDTIEELGLEQLNLETSLKRTLEYTNIIKRLSSLDSIKELLATAERLDKAILAKSGECGSLESSLKEHRKLSKVINSIPDMEGLKSDLDKAEGLEKEIKELSGNKTDLNISLKQYKKHSKVVSSVKGLDVLKSDLDRLEELEGKIEKFVGMKNALKGTLLNYSRFSENLTGLKLIIRKKQDELPDTCPECGKPLED